MQTQRLFKPLTVGRGTTHALTLNNRILMAPMTRGRATDDAVPTDIMQDYYEQRASAGLIFTEATGISRQGNGWHHAPSIFSDKQRDAWKPVVERVHNAGGKLYLQLWHMGRQAHSSVTGERIVSASPIPLQQEATGKNHEKHPAETPHALTEAEIAQVVQDYRHASQQAKEAGFDGVEIHGANGYLVDQFLQSSTNVREDSYGGTLENRLRFMCEVIDAVLEVWPAERVSIRLGPNGTYGEMGSKDNLETFDAAIAEVAKRKLGILHVMTGLGFGFHELTEPYTASRVRKVVREAGAAGATVVVLNVGFTAESGEAALEEAENEEGDAVETAIAFGRPFIANPDLPQRIAKQLPLAEAQYPDWWNDTTTKGYSDWPTATGEQA